MAARAAALTGIVVQADAVLLDTCAVIWIAEGIKLSPMTTAALIHAGLAGGIFVSPVSAWEIGLLAAHGMNLLPDAKRWFARVMARPAIGRAEFTDDIAIDSATLPGDFHRDPADRLLVATARARDMAIMTGDCKILDYARAGHVRAIAC